MSINSGTPTSMELNFNLSNPAELETSLIRWLENRISPPTLSDEGPARHLESNNNLPDWSIVSAYLEKAVSKVIYSFLGTELVERLAIVNVVEVDETAAARPDEPPTVFQFNLPFIHYDILHILTYLYMYALSLPSRFERRSFNTIGKIMLMKALPAWIKVHAEVLSLWAKDSKILREWENVLADWPRYVNTGHLVTIDKQLETLDCSLIKIVAADLLNSLPLVYHNTPLLTGYYRGQESIKLLATKLSSGEFTLPRRISHYSYDFEIFSRYMTGPVISCESLLQYSKMAREARSRLLNALVHNLNLRNEVLND